MSDRAARPSTPATASRRAHARPGPRLALRLVAALALAALALGPLATVSLAADSVTMTARVLLQGHGRAGAWMAVEVRLENAGPAVTGELRLEGGTATRTRFATPVDLPTASRKTYTLYGQPPAFGRTLTVNLVGTDGSALATATAAYIAHDITQLVVGVVAEKPDAIVGDLSLPPSITNAAAVIAPLTVGDLPDRVEGWAPLDRLIWQDVDASALSPAQLAALRGWLAAGGRLVIAAGTAGIGTLAAFPDDLLPFRPASTADLGADVLADYLGGAPATTGAIPMLLGDPGTGRALVTASGRWSSADMTYGNGAVTLLGFDPTGAGIGKSDAAKALWQRLLPPRSGSSSPAISDDSNLLSATGQVPSLALPPIGGLLVLLAAYIAIIGPINYLVLRRLDRRELAWVTMPILVVGFAVAAYAYGGFLRGTDVIVNQVAIVRGAPDATEGQASVYFGLFSPDRHTYQIEVAGGALLAAPISGDIFGTGQTATLDIVQGDPARVRDLEVGFASLRTVRGETPTTVPRMKTSFMLDGTTLRGTFENASDQTLESVAVVLGSSVVVLGDVPPHTSKAIMLPVRSDPFGQTLADKILGQIFNNGGGIDDAARQRSIRYALVNQLLVDPSGMGFIQSGLQAEQPVILAFASASVLDVKVSGQSPRSTGSILYYVPAPMAVRGAVTFEGDLVRSTVVDNQAMLFSKDPYSMNLPFGKVTVAYRPVAFGGQLTATKLRFIVDFPGNVVAPGDGKEVQPLESVPPTCLAVQDNTTGCVQPRQDGMPEVEVWDRTGAGAWVRLPRLSQGVSYTLTDPARYVDPQTGTVLVRFVNDNSQGMTATFSFRVAIEGTVQ